MPLEKTITITGDGSATITIPSKNITYHSLYGAVQESMHIFINCGLQYFMESQRGLAKEDIAVFEMGLGTGLNALLSWKASTALKQKLLYHSIELHPLTEKEVMYLDYDKFMEDDNFHLSRLHHSGWDILTKMNPYFSFIKTKADIRQFNTGRKFNIIYFDAFDPNVQPELWTESIFKKMYSMLQLNGILVTYCSKGTVQRTLKTAGFAIEKLKGPPGKREIIRATKTIH